LPGSSAGSVGVILISIISISSKLQFGFRMVAHTETLMTSVERILEYGKLTQETNKTSKVSITDKEKRGDIVFKDVWLRYAATEPYVLKGIDFSITAKEKVTHVSEPLYCNH
jgi:ABC-type multidrug transport system fused ATPase/permease subunit